MNPLIGFVVFAGVFAASTAAVIAARFLMDRLRDDRPGQSPGAWNEQADDMPLLKAEQLSTISFWDGLLKRFDWVEILGARLAEAGLQWSVGRLTAMMLLAGTTTLAMLTQFDWVPRFAAMAATGLAAFVPYLMVLRRRARRLRQLEEQFPEALDSLSRSLRAGHPLAAGLELLARESPAPLSVEMRKTVDERNLGMPWEQALEHLAARVPIVEVSVFAAAVQVQSRTGGKLHEVMARLSETMRESASLKGEVRSIASHGRMTGMILTIMPVGIAVTMFFTSPVYLQVLWQNPLGRDMIAAAAGCLVAAHFVIRRMVDVKI